jgi:hypothetical protein
MLIAGKAVSDFGAHIPLIRSFSMGDNLTRFTRGTVEYPIFPGEPIRYHYLFYMLVGILERLGLRIDWALNVPSALGFFALIILLYLLAKWLFHSAKVGVLTVIFFLFNGSFAFLQFFSLHPLSTTTIRDIVQLNNFPSFAPWGPGFVSAFWNLNIYTNQRHLASAFAIVLLFIYTIVKDKKFPPRQQVLRAIPWGIVFGFFPYFHQPSLLIVAICMTCYFFFYPRSRLFLIGVGLISACIAIPQLTHFQSQIKTFEWYPGYFIHNELLAQKSIPQMLLYLLTFWWQNLGFHSVLILIGFFLIPKNARRAILPVIPIFIIPNLFKFSVEVSANHKFFNFVMLFGVMISAYVIVRLARIKIPLLLSIVRLGVLAGLVGFLTLSGIIDFFPVYNDGYAAIQDIPKNTVATWIRDNTPTDAVFLNSSYSFHPATIAGRKIFQGWPYYSWSAGYDTNQRFQELILLYESTDTSVFCRLINLHHISYITYQEPFEISEIHFSLSTLASHARRVYTNQTYSIWVPLCQ